TKQQLEQAKQAQLERAKQRPSVRRLVVVGVALGLGLAVGGWQVWLPVMGLANAVFVLRCLVNFFKDDWAGGKGRFEGPVTALAAFTLSINLVFHLQGALTATGWSQQISGWFFALDIAFLTPLLPVVASWLAHQVHAWRGKTPGRWTNPTNTSNGLRRLAVIG